MLKILCALLLLVMTFAAWSNTFYSPFVFDDQHFILDNGAVNGQKPITLRSPRALTVTTLRLNAAFFGFEPSSFHATNLLLHLTVSLTLYLLLGPVLGTSSAFLSTGFFLLHPLQSEAVTYISARADILMTLFCVVAVLCATKRQYYLSGLSCLLAIMSKESGVVSVLLVLAYCWHEGRLTKRVAVPILAIFGAFTAYRVISENFLNSGRSLVEHAILQNAQFWFYLTRLVYPFGLSLDHDPESYSSALIAVSGLATVALIHTIHRFLDRKYWIWPVWVAIILTPRFLLNVPEYLAERHIYAAMPAISVMFALALNQAFVVQGARTHECH